jgi:membrane protein YqaA with SNARE-associated domain
MKLDRTNAFAALWGLAEAIVFFVVPDVLLSWLALQSYKRAFVACLWVLGGALLGGCVVWFIGQNDPEPVRTLFASLPAIRDDMFANVRLQLEENGLVALFVGPLTGTPYKIYALETADSGYGLATFVLISIPARLVRFLLVTIVAGAASQILQQRLSLRVLQGLHIAFWVSFYAWFFHVMAEVH